MYKKLLCIILIEVITISLVACGNSVNNEQEKESSDNFNSQNTLNVINDDFLNCYVYKDEEERVHLTTEEQLGITKLIKTRTSLFSELETSAEEYIVDDLLIIDKVDNMFSLWYSFIRLKAIYGIENIITKSVSAMFNFNNVPLNINKLNTKYITDMSYMFYECNNL